MTVVIFLKIHELISNLWASVTDPKKQFHALSWISKITETTYDFSSCLLSTGAEKTRVAFEDCDPQRDDLQLLFPS